MPANLDDYTYSQIASCRGITLRSPGGCRVADEKEAMFPVLCSGSGATVGSFGEKKKWRMTATQPCLVGGILTGKKLNTPRDL